MVDRFCWFERDIPCELASHGAAVILKESERDSRKPGGGFGRACSKPPVAVNHQEGLLHQVIDVVGSAAEATQERRHEGSVPNEQVGGGDEINGGHFWFLYVPEVSSPSRM